MEVSHYGRMIWRGRWLVLISALVACATTYAYARMQTPMYRSSVRLEVIGRVDYGQVMAAEKLLRQLAARTTTLELAAQVDRMLGLNREPRALLSQMRIQPSADTMQIQVDVDDRDPASAARLADAVARVAVDRQSLLMAEVPTGERIDLRQLDPASPGQFVSPQTRSLVAAGLAFGVIVGLATSLILGMLDQRVHSAAELELMLSLPALGVFPGPSSQSEARLATQATLAGASSENSR